MNASFSLEPIEKASVDELRALQLKRLQATLMHAYQHAPVYRQKWDAAGVHPSDCRTLADLAKFPFTTKADLRAHYPFGMFAVPREKLARVHASSGTTGKPTVVGYTAADIDTWAQLVARSIRAGGARTGDIVHVSYGYGLFTGGLGAHYGAEKLGLTVVPFGGGQTERQVQLIRDFGASIIMVTPSYMLAIADEFERQGVAASESSLRIGIFGAEPWTNEMRAEIERRLTIDAVDIYGLSEVMGPGVASECVETKDGPTIWEDHFYPEIIDPETGAPLPDGEFGELVFTSLTKEALPIIRYRTRDLTRLLPPTSRSMRRMGRIKRSPKNADALLPPMGRQKGHQKRRGMIRHRALTFHAFAERPRSCRASAKSRSDASSIFSCIKAKNVCRSTPGSIAGKISTTIVPCRNFIERRGQYIPEFKAISKQGTFRPE